MFVLVDFKVASSIYRRPWLIESEAAIKYMELVEQIKGGSAKFSKPKAQEKKFYASAEVTIAPVDRYSAKDHPGYDGKSLAILPIEGPLMKEDYCGWYGTSSLRNEFNKISSTDSIKTIVLHIDSPGGQVDGTEPFANAIKASDKEVIALINGTAASAAYWLASAADKIVATAQTDIVGSIGTMISFYDRSSYLEDQGIVLREYYADASADKNKMMREAMDGNGHLLIEEMLNPTNDIFLAAVKANRGDKLNQKDTLSGKTFLASKALENGLIDEIASFDNTVNNLLAKHKTPQIAMNLNKFKAILAFFGLAAAASSEKVELKEDDLQKIDAALTELNQVKVDLQTANEKITGLEAASKKDQETITGLQSQVTALTTERDNLKAENEKLGNADAGTFSKTTGGKDTFNDQKADPLQMDFQIELNNKL